jgi:hypothetical protein
MVILFMDDERQSSGTMFIPDSPYFIDLFLWYGADKTRHPYVGSYFKKSGRYVCTDRSAVGELVTSRFNVLKAYRTYFYKERDDDPAISGLAWLWHLIRRKPIKVAKHWLLSEKFVFIGSQEFSATIRLIRL